MPQVPNSPQEPHFVPGVARAPRYVDQVPGYTMRREDADALNDLTMPFEASREVSPHTVPLGNLATGHKKTPIETTGEVDLAYKDQFERYALQHEGILSLDTNTAGVIPENDMVRDFGVSGKTSMIIDLAEVNNASTYAETTVFVVDRGEKTTKGRFLVAPYKTAVEEWRFGPQGPQDLDGYVKAGKLWMFDPGQSVIIGRQGLERVEGQIGIPMVDTGVSRKHAKIQFDPDAITVANLKDYTYATVNPRTVPK